MHSIAWMTVSPIQNAERGHHDDRQEWLTIAGQRCVKTDSMPELSSSTNSNSRRSPGNVGARRGILLVAERPAFRMRLHSLVQQIWPRWPVALADSLTGARRELSVQHVDLAIIDMDLSANSGVEMLRQIVCRDPLVVSVVFSNDDRHLTQALSAGAHGYLLKDQTDEVLVAQLKLTLAGVPPLAPVVAQKLLDHFAATAVAAAGCVPGSTELEETRSRRLSHRERAVLGLIAKGMQITEVADELDISANTVGGYLKNIYRKRKVTSRAQAALEARKLGLA